MRGALTSGMLALGIGWPVGAESEEEIYKSSSRAKVDESLIRFRYANKFCLANEMERQHWGLVQAVASWRCCKVNSEQMHDLVADESKSQGRASERFASTGGRTELSASNER